MNRYYLKTKWLPDWVEVSRKDYLEVQWESGHLGVQEPINFNGLITRGRVEAVVSPPTPMLAEKVLDVYDPDWRRAGPMDMGFPDRGTPQQMRAYDEKVKNARLASMVAALEGPLDPMFTELRKIAGELRKRVEEGSREGSVLLDWAIRIEHQLPPVKPA